MKKQKKDKKIRKKLKYKINKDYYSQVNKFNNIEKSYLKYLLKNVVPYND